MDGERDRNRQEGSLQQWAGLERRSCCISLEAEVPEVLFEGMRDFIQSHPQWDQYSVITSALAGFLFQNGCQDSQVSEHYLDSLFMHPSAS